MDKYWRRPLEEYTGDIGLDGISLAQFIKRSTRGTLKLKDSDMIQTLQSPEIDQDIEDDFIIALDPLKRLSIPKCFKLTSELPEDNVETMKLRKPLVLRYHKFKQSSEPHDFYYSEQLLYYPHTCNEDLFPEDLEK